NIAVEYNRAASVKATPVNSPKAAKKAPEPWGSCRRRILRSRAPNEAASSGRACQCSRDWVDASTLPRLRLRAAAASLQDSPGNRKAGGGMKKATKTMRVPVFPWAPAANESELKAFEHLKNRLISTPGDDEWALLTNLAFSVTHQLQSN